MGLPGGSRTSFDATPRQRRSWRRDGVVGCSAGGAVVLAEQLAVDLADRFELFPRGRRRASPRARTPAPRTPPIVPVAPGGWSDRLARRWVARRRTGFQGLREALLERSDLLAQLGVPVHRGVLQPPQVALHAWLPLPRAGRARAPRHAHARRLTGGRSPRPAGCSDGAPRPGTQLRSPLGARSAANPGALLSSGGPHPALPSSVRALSYSDTVNSERVHGTGAVHNQQARPQQRARA